METQIYEAFVLKKVGTHIALLEQQVRLDGIWRAHFPFICIHTGSVIRYGIEGYDGQLPNMVDIQIEYTPFGLSDTSLCFLHNILEVCWRFIPVGACVSTIFAYLQQVYQHLVRIDDMFCQKLLLCKLFALLGWYPHNQKFTDLVDQIVQKPVDKIIEETIHLPSKEIDIWLQWCIQEHPQGKWFRSAHCLMRQK